MNKTRHGLVMLLLVCIGIITTSREAFGQVVSADRFRSNDTGGNGQFWERLEDSQNTIRWVYGPLGSAGVVDITNPLFNRYRITGRGSAIWVGRTDLGADVALPTGAGGRMLWSVVKRAFRVGEVTDGQWDDVNVGQNSFANGFNTTASGSIATALGDTTTASGAGSIAMGSFAAATATNSIVVGRNITNSLANSLMVGFNSTAASLFVGPADGTNKNLGFVVIGGTTPFTANTRLTVNGTVAAAFFTQTSDIRLKTNIRGIEGALEKVLSLKGIRYEWKAVENSPINSEGTQLGFSAQDVEKVLPEVISADADGYKGISYQNITPVIVEAMKEQQQIIEKQKSEIEQLKAQLQVVMEKLALPTSK
ncbi:MAG: tail fiber domain-containing protein [Acidobacteriota bacterium]